MDKVFASNNMAQISKLFKLKPNREGVLYVYRQDHSTLLIGILGKDIGMKIIPPNIRPPSKFTQALKLEGIKYLPTIRQLLGPPQQAIKLYEQLYSCQQSKNLLYVYYVVFDDMGNFYGSPFSYKNIKKIGSSRFSVEK